MKKLLLISSLLLISTFGYSQPNIDSLDKVANQPTDLNGSIWATKNLIWHYRDRDIDSAWNYVNHLERIHQLTGSKKALLEYYVYSGDLHAVSMNYLKACESMFNLVGIAEADSVWDYKVFGYLHISNNFISLQQYDKALTYADSARILSENKEQPLYASDAYTNMALAYQHLEMYPLAVEYNLKALNIRNEVNEVRSMITSYNNLGITYKKWGKLDEALDAYFHVIPLCHEINYIPGLFRVYNNIGNLYRENDQTSSALQYYLKCDSIYYNYDQTLPLDVQEAFAHGLTDVYLKLGDNTKSSKYFKMYSILEDSLSKTQVENATMRLENQISFFENEAALLSQNMELKEDKQEADLALLKSQKNISITIAIILGFVVFVFILIYVLRRQVRLTKQKEEQKRKSDQALQTSLDEKKSLQEKLKQKSNEITNLALGIQNKNEILDQLLQDISEHSGDAAVNAKLKEIYKKVREIIQLDRDRDLLELYISDIHHDFDQKMRGLSGELTEKEIKIGGLIRLGMSSKEISQLLNVSPGSVDTYRYNIRKKLNMGKDKSLAKVLAEL